MSAGSTPRAVTRCSTTKGPMKPAPPVIRIFFPAKNSVTRGGLPVDPGGPALAMLGVPLDALAHALLPRVLGRPPGELVELAVDRKSTRLNSSHVRISYAVFCLKKTSSIKERA